MRDSRLPSVSPAAALDFKQYYFKFVLVGAERSGVSRNWSGRQTKTSGPLGEIRAGRWHSRLSMPRHGSVPTDDEDVVVGDGAEGLVLLDHRLIRLASLESAIPAGLVS